MAEEKAKAEKEEAPKPGKKKTILLAAAVVAVVALGAGGFFVFKGKAVSGTPGEEAAHEETKESHGKEEGGHGTSKGATTAFLSLDPFIVNLQDNSGTRYLKLTVNLELTPGTTQSELNAHNARIRDAIIILLSSKSYADIGSVEGKYQLRDEVVQRINQFLSKEAVKTVYFTEFVIQ